MAFHFHSSWCSALSEAAAIIHLVALWGRRDAFRHCLFVDLCLHKTIKGDNGVRPLGKGTQEIGYEVRADK